MASVFASTIAIQAHAGVISGRRPAQQARAALPPPRRTSAVAPRRAVVAAALESKAAEKASPENLTAESFEALVSSGPAFLLDFYTSWCGPCKIVAAGMKKLAPSYEGRVEFVGINCENNYELTKLLEIKALPTLMFYKDGKLVERWQGVTSAQDLDLKLKGFLK